MRDQLEEWQEEQSQDAGSQENVIEWPAPDTLNKEDTPAYKYSECLNLTTRALTSLMSENRFYESAEESDNELLRSFEEVLKEDPEYAKGLVLALRQDFHLRSVTHVLAAELAHRQVPETADIIEAICERPDDMKEILAYYTKKYGDKKLPNSIKKGLGKAFAKFNEYQLSKYDQKGKVWLRDILRISHPKPANQEQAELWKKVVKDELAPAETWEHKISSEGSTTENWAELVKDNKLGYMALLRNLRNLLKKDVPMEVIDQVCAKLTDPEQVKKSKQLPFRFFSAYKSLKSELGKSQPNRRQWLYDEGDDNRGNLKEDKKAESDINACKVEKVFDALEKAARLSACNLPKLNGTSVIACDVSSSMEMPISEKSSVERFDIGLVMGALANGFSDKDITGIFGDTWKEIELDPNKPLTSTWEMHRREGEVGYATNGYQVIKSLLETRRKVDRVLFFTDCQMYGRDTYNEYSEKNCDIRDFISRYRKEINKDLKLYFFDMAGYGNCVIPEQDPQTMIVGGWSEKLFDIIPAFEEGGKGANALEKRIRDKYQEFKNKKIQQKEKVEKAA
jgi:hypothetical protein